MKSLLKFSFEHLILTTLIFLVLPDFVRSQEDRRQITDYDDYTNEVMEQDDDFLSAIEEWRIMIDQWLEKPLCINNEEADWLMEYKIISLYQLNKLKEYRMIYGDLLSLFELEFIDGWDFQTTRKVKPLVTADTPSNTRTFKKIKIKSFRQSLVIKTAFNTQMSKAYDSSSENELGSGDPFYFGSPVKFALRYDLEYRNKLAFGLRMEKDPGEPFLISSGSLLKNFKTPDLLSGYLQINRLGPVQSLIIGNYRVNFGYGINIAGGQSGIKGRNGIAGMAHRIKPQTSVSETGFFRGVALYSSFGKFSLTGFASLQKIDGTSVVIDSLTGNPLSFGSINKSGLHRTISELEKRKIITEKVIGGFLVYRNNWLKTGVIALYNQFNANLEKSSRPYDKFSLNRMENLITGISATCWLPKFQFFTEASMSINKGAAMLSGFQLMPVPGIQIIITYRFFEVDYHNGYGSGFISSSRNAGENGLQLAIRTELQKKWLIEVMTDNSRSQWANYDLSAPSRQNEFKLLVEKAWSQARAMAFTFKHLEKAVTDPDISSWICHPMNLSEYRFRLEGRLEAMEGVKFKSRIECKLVQDLPPGWLIFQDIEINPERFNAKFWLRACFFDVMDYNSRIYAYENDVLYDFTSFMHYGKGIRGIIMVRWAALNWLELWLRLSTIYYTNKHVGSGWDEVEGNRQNEIEIQVRIKTAN